MWESSWEFTRRARWRPAIWAGACAAALQAAVQANHFGVMQVHNLKETMTKKGVELGRECLIFEVCQPPEKGRTEL